MLPLDFQRTYQDDNIVAPASLNDTLGSGQELFEGIDIQPHSDTPGTNLSTESDEESDLSASSDE